MDALRRLKAEIFQALGHPTRLAILEALQEREITVGEILSHLGIGQGNVSQHLAILRNRRLVTTRKEGNRVFYSLRDPVLERVLVDMRRYTASLLGEDLTLLRAMRRGAESRPRSVARGRRKTKR